MYTDLVPPEIGQEKDPVMKEWREKRDVVLAFLDRPAVLERF